MIQLLQLCNAVTRPLCWCEGWALATITVIGSGCNQGREYSTVQQSTGEDSTVQCSRVQQSTVQYSAVEYRVVEYRRGQYSTL